MRNVYTQKQTTVQLISVGFQVKLYVTSSHHGFKSVFTFIYFCIIIIVFQNKQLLYTMLYNATSMLYAQLMLILGHGGWAGVRTQNPIQAARHVELAKYIASTRANSLARNWKKKCVHVRFSARKRDVSHLRIDSVHACEHSRSLSVLSWEITCLDCTLCQYPSHGHSTITPFFLGSYSLMDTYSILHKYDLKHGNALGIAYGHIKALKFSFIPPSKESPH